jgi:DNA polymerase-3 subunit gamma/tau
MNTQAKASAASLPGNLSRTPKSTSLKSLVKEPEATPQPVVNEQAKQSSPFSEEDLIRCWDAFSETLVAKDHLKNTMINCKPVLLDNFKFEVRVHNPAQKEELLSYCLDLLKSIRVQLKNDLIQISIRIDETIEKKIAYTSAEKFEFLNNINPLLSKMIEDFDLATE